MDEVCTQVLDSARWLAGVMKYPPPGDPVIISGVAQYDSAVIFGGEENPGGPGDLAQYLTLPKAQLAVAPVSDICNSVREGGKERFVPLRGQVLLNPLQRVQYRMRARH
jgi:hypothetical protein